MEFDPFQHANHLHAMHDGSGPSEGFRLFHRTLYPCPRYPRRERVIRLLRREWDLLKTRELQRMNLQEIISSNTIDLGLGKAIPPWPQNRPQQTATQHLVEIVRLAKQVIRTP